MPMHESLSEAAENVGWSRLLLLALLRVNVVSRTTALRWPSSPGGSIVLGLIVLAFIINETAY